MNTSFNSDLNAQSPLMVVTAADCPNCRRVKALLELFQIKFEEAKAASNSSKEVRKLAPRSIYMEAPVLIHGECVIEDWRIILLYIDEIFCGNLLEKLGPEKTNLIFERLENSGVALEEIWPKAASLG